MNVDGRSPLPRRIWAYGYALVPPVARWRLGPMEALLDDGHEKAVVAARTWEGRLINGDDITHILVVCDTPDQHAEVNRRLEAELERLNAPFALSLALAIDGRPGTGSMPDASEDS